MTLHICILGIDGSGKSTITAALPAILAGELNLVASSVGEAIYVVGPDEDHVVPNFTPDGLPFSAKLARRFKRAAKKFADYRKIYPIFKIAQMAFQDSAAHKLGNDLQIPVLISDGNTLLSATGRAANYLQPASLNTPQEGPTREDLSAVFAYVLEGRDLPEESKKRLPSLRKAKLIGALNRALRLNSIWLPDIVLFLDLSPQIALQRIASRHQKIDIHENLADLQQARDMYLKTLSAVQHYRSNITADSISIDQKTPGQTLAAVIEILRPHVEAHQALQAKSDRPLGTTATKLSGNAVLQKILNRRYMFRYLIPKFFKGAWREPLFIFSGLGKLFLKEGYSAGIMRVIYDRDEKKPGLMDRNFLEYPLHRAVYDRLQILTRKIEPELEKRLTASSKVVILTAPSGFAYDLFCPIESISKRLPEAMSNINLVAADLDPHGYIAEELKDRAARVGIRFSFLQGDITSAAFRNKLSEFAPYDLALFIGLSSWLPKPQMLQHMKWLRSVLKSSGVLVTDSFTAEAYALSGRYLGYKANYYTPEVYRSIVDYCGFGGIRAEIESGRDYINHVVMAHPR